LNNVYSSVKQVSHHLPQIQFNKNNTFNNVSISTILKISRYFGFNVVGDTYGHIFNENSDT